MDILLHGGVGGMWWTLDKVLHIGQVAKVSGGEGDTWWTRCKCMLLQVGLRRVY